MPYKDPKKANAYWRKYRARKVKENPEQEAERKLLLYQKHLEARRKKNEAANRARGHKPRPKGPNAKPEVHVSTSKRFRFIAGMIYFTSKRGFTIAEVREILRFAAQEKVPAPPPAARASKKRPASPRKGARR